MEVLECGQYEREEDGLAEKLIQIKRLLLSGVGLIATVCSQKQIAGKMERLLQITRQLLLYGRPSYYGPILQLVVLFPLAAETYRTRFAAVDQRLSFCFFWSGLWITAVGEVCHLVP